LGVGFGWRPFLLEQIFAACVAEGEAKKLQSWVAQMAPKEPFLIAVVIALVFGISPPDPDLTGGSSPTPPNPTVLAKSVTV
jgi:hypothetical protein